MTRFSDAAREPNANVEKSADKEVALVLSGDGAICSVLHATFDVAPNESINSLWSDETCEHIRANLRRALRNRKFFSEELNQDKDGKSADFTYIAQGRDRVLLVARDTSRRREALKKLRRLAFVDEATTLPNREYFADELQSILEHQRLREGRAAVICCHIDDLDAQHGTLGTTRYDMILQELGERMIRELRGANSSEEDDYERRTVVARVDFRRFAVILPKIEGGTDAESVTERLTERLHEPVEIEGTKYQVRVHCGIALFPQDGADADTLFANANAAMEEARTGLTGHFAFHSGTVKLKTLQRQDLEVELRSALERGSFALNFLPIVDAHSGELTAIEALLRWPDSVMGSCATSKLIGLAERTGLIVPIGEWVLNESFDQLKTWHDAGHAELRLTVNLSMQEFSRQDIASRMAALMLQVGVQPTLIDLEITEKMLSRDAIAGYKAMDALKALGVRLFVDDYGTGACTIAQLAHSPVDGIKIDNSLVSGALSCKQDRAACAAAISSASALGLASVAEGVETKEHATLLTELGCDLLQGFHFSTPMSPADLHRFLDLGIGKDQE